MCLPQTAESAVAVAARRILATRVGNVFSLQVAALHVLYILATGCV
jgi:hypothetical protein